jgi:hypothetical protein
VLRTARKRGSSVGSTEGESAYMHLNAGPAAPPLPGLSTPSPVVRWLVLLLTP